MWLVVMEKFSKKKKILIGSLASAAVAALALPVIIYTTVLPAVVSNQHALNFFREKVNKFTGFDLQIQNPVLKTGFSPIIEFKTDSFQLSKNDAIISSGQNFQTVISIKEILNKKIILKKFGVDYFFADVNQILSLAQPSEKPQQKSDWIVDWFSSDLYVKNSIIVYEIDDKTFLKIDADKLELNTAEKVRKPIHFKVFADLKKDKKHLIAKFEDKNNVYIKDKKIFVDNLEFDVNKSKLFLSADADQKNNFNLKVSSKKFSIKDTLNLINSNIIENNINESLVFFDGIDGDFDFDFYINNTDLKGDINLNRLDFKVIPVANIPVKLTQGKIKLTNDKILLKDFKGIYNGKAENKLDFEGDVKDYLKSIDTNINANAVVTNDFTKNFLSKMVGYPIEIIGKPDTKLIYKSKYNKMDIKWIFSFNPSQGFKIGGEDFTPSVKLHRALVADMHFEDMFLNINSIDYYMVRAENADKSHGEYHPILTFKGNLDLKNEIPVIKDFGFEIPNPLPSEFLNMIAKQAIFKKGTIAGKLNVDFNGKYPILDGNLTAEGVRIPSQRLGIKKGVFYTKNNNIYIKADGRYRRIAYNFDGNILNEIKLPIIIKDLNLTLDNIDVERIMNTFNSQPVIADNKAAVQPVELSDDDDVMTFDVGNIIVEDSSLKILKGNYKDLEFGNIEANMTLDKNSKLLITSNKFDIAEGISTLKVDCDLKKQLYYVRLGILDVNSNTIAKTLLGLDKEITGKAKGLIELNADKSLKLNGLIRFAVDNGAIGKIGFVEYIMKLASVFRNPLAMISPGIIADLTTIPDGRFDKITGNLTIKDNVINNIDIKSQGDLLATLIRGRFDLESRDTTLRIYTKFSNNDKGFYGFMRNFSLNALSNRIPFSNKNESNYYAAEIEQIPDIKADEKNCQIFLTKVEGDVEHNNFLSSLKKLK